MRKKVYRCKVCTSTMEDWEAEYSTKYCSICIDDYVEWPLPMVNP